MKTAKNKIKSASPEEKFGDSYKEIVDTFFGKSASFLSKELKSRKQKKLLLFASGVLFAALALFGVISILYINRLLSHSKKPYGSAILHYTEDIIKNGGINRVIVEEVYFDGDAKEKSSFLSHSIKLVNQGEYGRAALVIRFGDPIDLKEKNVLIYGRASHGTKKISLVLKDSKNRVMELRDINLFSDWTLRHSYVDKKFDFDPERVKELKIESGSHTAGNENGSIIFIQDINIRGVR